MLTDIEFDKNCFVQSLVDASYKLRQKDIRPDSVIIPQTIFNHFKDRLYFEHFFSKPTQWQADLWNSKHNPINFDQPMFMGLKINVVPDAANSGCYLCSASEFGNLKVAWDYSLKNVRIFAIKSNLTIIVKSRANVILQAPKNEQCAIETLREMITEVEFRKYMKYGFVLVKGKSGKQYQIFRNQSHTKVWYNGMLVEEVCVRIKDSKIPLTDNLIAFKTLIETNEEEFRKLGNVYKMIA